jgi:UDP:flavonoid glycosyltransferase YjiC (YdhE family)
MRIISAMFQGGGNIPLLMPIMAHLVERGHAVKIIAGPGIRRSRLPVSAQFGQRIAESSASLVPFREPAKHPLDDAPPLRGLLGDWVPKPFRGIPAERQTVLWSSAWAENVSTALRREAADLVIADYYLLGALAAAEAARVPSVALMRTVSVCPISGMPPYGTGWLPSRTPVGFVRDGLGRAALACLDHRNGLKSLNALRGSLGLDPLRWTFEQYDRAARVPILVSSSFDFFGKPSANVLHVGTPTEDTAKAPAWSSPWSPKDERPFVVVALSTLDQGQAPLLHRILRALAGLDLRALVTLGPALNPVEFSAPPNVILEPVVPHSAVLPHAAALVTQCGLGTLTKALVCGILLVCIPLVGDQPDNAARVVARGAGIRIKKEASPERIAAAIDRVLTTPQFREASRRLGTSMLNEGDAVLNAVETIEGPPTAAAPYGR